MIYELEERGTTFSILHATGQVRGTEGLDFVKALTAQATRLKGTPSLRVVVDLKDKFDIHPEILDRLLPIGQELTAQKLKIYFVNVPIGTAGLLLHPPAANFSHVLISAPARSETKASAAPATSEPQLMAALTQGVLGAMDMLCPQIRVTAGAAAQKPKGSKVVSDISAQVGIRGKNFDGILLLSFPEAVYLKLLSAMHDENYTDMSQVSDDGASELVNILRSLTRKQLHDAGFVVAKDIPAITHGDLIEKLLRDYDGVLAVPFETSHGVFHCQVGMTMKDKP